MWVQTVKQKTKLGIRQQLECAFGSVQPVNVHLYQKEYLVLKPYCFMFMHFFLCLLRQGRLGGDTVLMHSIQVHHHN